MVSQLHQAHHGFRDTELLFDPWSIIILLRDWSFCCFVLTVQCRLMVFNKNHSKFQTLLPVTSILLALRFVPDFEKGGRRHRGFCQAWGSNAVRSAPGTPALAGQVLLTGNPHEERMSLWMLVAGTSVLLLRYHYSPASAAWSQLPDQVLNQNCNLFSYGLHHLCISIGETSQA